MTTQISNQSWSAPTAHMCYPEQHVANFLQRLLFEFLRQGPLLLLLLLIPQGTGVADPGASHPAQRAQFGSSLYLLYFPIFVIIFSCQ